LNNFWFKKVCKVYFREYESFLSEHFFKPMTKRDLIHKIKYPQPHNIHIYTGNDALDQRVIEYLHAKAKYVAKYQKSKRSKRQYNY